MKLVLAVMVGLALITGQVHAANGNGNGNGKKATKTHCGVVHMYVSKGKCVDARDRPADGTAMDQQLQKTVW